MKLALNLAVGNHYMGAAHSKSHNFVVHPWNCCNFDRPYIKVSLGGFVMATDCSALEQALSSLEAALTPAPRNDRERDGAIQRFEYTFELCWKTAKKVLKDIGIESQAPKLVIRELGQQKWINNVEQWLDFLKARNASSHTYNIQTAEWVFAQAKSFAVECRGLLGILRAPR